MCGRLLRSVSPVGYGFRASPDRCAVRVMIDVPFLSDIPDIHWPSIRRDIVLKEEAARIEIIMHKPQKRK